jgi:hypothetical protein
MKCIPAHPHQHRDVIETIVRHVIPGDGPREDAKPELQGFRRELYSQRPVVQRVEEENRGKKEENDDESTQAASHHAPDEEQEEDKHKCHEQGFCSSRRQALFVYQIVFLDHRFTSRDIDLSSR